MPMTAARQDGVPDAAAQVLDRGAPRHGIAASSWGQLGRSISCCRPRWFVVGRRRYRGTPLGAFVKSAKECPEFEKREPGKPRL
jgi:hypothetical protein